MKTESRVRRMYSKRLAAQLAGAEGAGQSKLRAQADREAEQVRAAMRDRGYRLASRLANGEGLFVRRRDWQALHVQLPGDLYEQLESACVEREASKRQIVIGALRAYLAGEIGEPVSGDRESIGRKSAAEEPPVAGEPVRDSGEIDDEEFYLG